MTDTTAPTTLATLVYAGARTGKAKLLHEYRQADELLTEPSYFAKPLGGFRAVGTIVSCTRVNDSQVRGPFHRLGMIEDERQVSEWIAEDETARTVDAARRQANRDAREQDIGQTTLNEARHQLALARTTRERAAMLANLLTYLGVA